jgi:hypothetical protein
MWDPVSTRIEAEPLLTVGSGKGWQAAKFVTVSLGNVGDKHDSSA